MEDFYEARIDDIDGEKVGMFGVYDGMYVCQVSLKVLIPLIFIVPAPFTYRPGRSVYSGCSVRSIRVTRISGSEF